MSLPHLILGNARYSSWSMRPYLALKRAGIEFTTEFLPLRTEEFRARMRQVSPFALVPTMLLGDDAIGDSWAICEWAAEQVPSLWPKDEILRAKARMLAGQMHAGFMPIRREMPMNLGRINKPRAELGEDVMQDIAKLSAGWGQALEQSGGPFLCGDWSIADAMYTPVATRFLSYGIKLPTLLQDYCDHLLQQPEYLEWKALADAETWVIDDMEQNYG